MTPEDVPEEWVKVGVDAFTGAFPDNYPDEIMAATLAAVAPLIRRAALEEADAGIDIVVSRMGVSSALGKFDDGITCAKITIRALAASEAPAERRPDDQPDATGDHGADGA